MHVLLGVSFVLIICLMIVLVFLADRVVKAVNRGRRRREANERLAAAAAVAEAKDQKRRAATEAREAITSIMPTIHDHETRHVDLSFSSIPADVRIGQADVVSTTAACPSR